MERRGEIVLALIIVVGLAAGLAWDVLGKPVAPPPDVQVAGPLFHERALFCPGRPRGIEGTSTVAAWTSSGEAADVSIGKDAGGATELAADAMRVEGIDTAAPFNVVASGAPVMAVVDATFSKPFNALGAAPCSDTSAGEWYFPEGSSAFRFDERLLIYNPFPDEAVVRITFTTPKGEEAKANLSQIPVASGESTVVKINEFIRQKDVLAATISSVRGRVVAWKMVFSHTEDRPPGVEFSLGATDTVTQAFFPIGRVDDDSDERITIFNPSDEEAKVTVSFRTESGVIDQPNQFVEMPIRRHSTKILRLGSLGGDPPPGPLSAILEVVNKVGVVAEQSVALGSSGFEGVASEFGQVEPADSWWLGPAAVEPSKDSIVLLNLGPRSARVDLSLLGSSGAPERPSGLQDIEVPPGRHFAIDLTKFTDGASPVVRLDSDQPVVASRIAQGKGDMGIVAGTPVTPTEP